VFAETVPPSADVSTKHSTFLRATFRRNPSNHSDNAYRYYNNTKQPIKCCQWCTTSTTP